MDWKKKLYFGDNLGIPREHVATEGADLIYLDPPFNSSATYNVLFKEKSDEETGARLQPLGAAELFEWKEIQFRAHRVETFPKGERKTRRQQDELF